MSRLYDRLPAIDIYRMWRVQLMTQYGLSWAETGSMPVDDARWLLGYLQGAQEASR